MKEDTDADQRATQDMPMPLRDGRPSASESGSGRLEVRCPNCHAPTEVAVDTSLTDLTCASCGSHFSLVDQSKATRMAPSLSKMGRFELIERIGVGGFGSVWKARDKELDRTVAIKIPRAGGMAPEEQEKFFREARAAAQLRHPSIVSVHEVGRDGESVYIVSDFVRGVTLGDWLSGQKLTSREAAELCAKIADALHHAHEKGVIHRDLKPANIMMDYDGQPHLMDFGLARRETGEVTVTMDGQVLGTPAYMSPEQAEGEAHTADRRSDVYSLGVILFQLLTGELPFRGNARMLIKQVIQDEPPSPRKLNGAVSKDLETIALKCLEKHPERRYRTADILAAELRRYLSGEPIQARPVGRIARVSRWAKRHRAAAALLAVLAGVAIVGPMIAVQQTVLRIERDELLADVRNKQAVLTASSKQLEEQTVQLARKNDELQNQLARNLIERGTAECQAGRIRQGVALFAAAYDAVNPNDPLRRSAQNLTAGWFRNMGTPLLHDGIVQGVAFSPDDKVIFTASSDASEPVRQWDADSGKPRGPPITTGRLPYAMAISTDGRVLLTGNKQGVAQVWDSQTGGPIGDAMIHNDAVRGLALSPDGRLAVTASEDRTARLWDAKTGRSLREPLKHESSVRAVTFTLDGRSFITCTSDGLIQVWDTDSAQPIGEPMRHGAKTTAVALSPDGKTLATGGWDSCARFWDLKDRKQIGVTMEHGSSVDSLAFSPDGTTLLTGCYDHTARLWDVPTGEQKGEPLRHDAAVAAVAFSHDGRRFLTGGWDNTAWLWDASSRQQLAFGTGSSGARHTELPHDGAVDAVAFTPDGRSAVTASADGTARIWEVVTGKPRGEPIQHGEHVTAVAVSPDGRTLVTGGTDFAARMWNLEDGKPIGEAMLHEDVLTAVQFSPDGQFVLTASKDKTCRRWDSTTGKSIGAVLRTREPVQTAKIAPDGRTAAIVWTGTVGIHDMATNSPLITGMGHPGKVLDVAFSPDGATLLTACEDHLARFWNVQTGEPVGEPLRSEEEMHAVAFSPDGQVAVTGSRDQTAQLWDVHTRKPIGQPLRHAHIVRAVAFSPDRRWVLSGGDDNVARIWPAPDLAVDTNKLSDWAKRETGLKVSVDGLIQRISHAEWVDARDRGTQTESAELESPSLKPELSLLRESVGQQRTVELQVAHVGNYADVVFLNSMSNFRGSNCFTVTIPKLTVAASKNCGISNLADFIGRRVRATGVVRERSGKIDIYIDDPAKAIEILTPEGQWMRPEPVAAKDSIREFVDSSVSKLRTMIGQQQPVAFRVLSTGGIDYIYLNSKEDFRSPDCFTAAIKVDQIEHLIELGLNTPKVDLIGKTVEVSGIVEEGFRHGQIKIQVTDVRAQLKIIDETDLPSTKKNDPASSPPGNK